MFASITRYRLHKGSMDELASRVDKGFAEEICAQPGFVSYEFVDCGDGEVMTISIFREAGGAAGSRDLAQRWTDENLQDLEFTRKGALDGEMLVSRANQDMLEPGHVGAARKFASARGPVRGPRGEGRPRSGRCRGGGTESSIAVARSRGGDHHRCRRS